MLVALYESFRRTVSLRLLPLLLLAAVCYAACAGCTSIKILMARRPVVNTVAQGLQVLRESNDPAMRTAAYRFLLNQRNYPDKHVPDDIVETVGAAWKTEPEAVTRMEALLAIGQLRGDERVRPHLLAGLDDPEPIVRETACELLAEHPTPDVVAALKERLQTDASVDVRLAAADALARIGTREAADALYRSLADADPAVRLHCRELLADLVGQDLGSDMAAWQNAIEQADFVPRRRSLLAWPF